MHYIQLIVIGEKPFSIVEIRDAFDDEKFAFSEGLNGREIVVIDKGDTGHFLDALLIRKDFFGEYSFQDLIDEMRDKWPTYGKTLREGVFFLQIQVVGKMNIANILLKYFQGKYNHIYVDKGIDQAPLKVEEYLAHPIGQDQRLIK